MDTHFVAAESIDKNIARVIQRAQAGGHGGSEREIRAIHSPAERLVIHAGTGTYRHPPQRQRAFDRREVQVGRRGRLALGRLVVRLRSDSEFCF